jgi:phosphoglucosamine mutase
LRLFGTDGVRGKANTELTPELAQMLGRAAAATLVRGEKQPLFVLGRDTRVSGQMLSMAMASGLMSAGVNVWDAGVIPTPALAYVTRQVGASAGVMISASHNPAIDNGIKFFSGDGFKLPDTVEEEIEAIMLDVERLPRVLGTDVGIYLERPELADVYVEHLRGLSATLTGLSVAVDCANGAASRIAPQFFSQLGAQVEIMACAPDGCNINVDCGSTHPQRLQQLVRENRADIGLAFDGDADRLIACDAQGRLVDGDSMLAICALHRKQGGQPAHNIVAGTVMSNFGLDALLERENIEMIRTKVGDRYLLDEMRQRGALLGAEQSGHCIFLEHSTTGDGMLSAVMLLNVMVERRATLAELDGQWERYPQVLINVPVTDRASAMSSEHVKEAIGKASAAILGRGRLLVRPSGTENLVRVMAEAKCEETARNVAMIVVDALKLTSA